MSKKVKLTILIVIVAVLAAALVWGITMRNNLFIPFGKYFDTQNSDNGVTHTKFEADVQGIQNIKLDFVSEGVHVVVTNEDKIRIEEISNTQMNEKDIMQCIVNGDTVVATSGLHNNWFSFLSWAQYGDINVTLYVPSSYKNNLDLHTVSGVLNVQDAHAAGMKLDTVSGAINASNAQSNVFDLNSVSGGILVKGCSAENASASNVSGAIMIDDSHMNKLNGKTISGAYSVSLNDMASQINISSVSGSLTLKLPENDGFTLKSSSVSGSVNNDFAMAHGVYKNGQNSVEVGTTSGSINIIKK